jgi:hypothetical protein
MLSLMPSFPLFLEAYALFTYVLLDFYCNLHYLWIY